MHLCRLENYRTDRRKNLYVGILGAEKGSYDGLRPLPFLKVRGPIQTKYKFLHISITNQANETKFGMWMFLGVSNMSILVRHPSLFWKGGVPYK